MTVRGGRGQQGMAAVTARELLANRRAAAPGLLISSPQLRGPGSAVGTPALALGGEAGDRELQGCPLSGDASSAVSRKLQLHALLGAH